MNLKWIKNKIQNQIKKVFSEKLKDILFPKTPNEQPDSPKTNTEVKKTHPWRLCPIGQHWVETHPLKVPESKKGPERTTTRQGHCRINPGKAEYYKAEELREIAHLHFASIINNIEIMPTPYNLTFPNGNKYDELIGGWTKFWNDILVPANPLPPDLVKALIATESSFKLLPDTNSTDGAARGLIQITENTRKTLQNPKGELRNHLIFMTAEESREPEVNIGAGIRWLHHKKYLLEYRLKREATWEEAIAEYKGIYHQIGKVERTDRIMKKIREHFFSLKKNKTQLK